MSSRVPSPPPPGPAPSSSSSPSSPPSSGPSPDDDTAASSDEVNARQKSRYYFFKSTPAHEAHKYMPTLLTTEGGGAAASSSSSSAASLSPQPVHPSPSSSPEPTAGSRWNAAGTWEEKDLSSWAHQRLTALLSFPSSSPSTPSIRVTNVTGDATLVFTRGKKRVGYDVSITAEWSAQCGAHEVKGAVELPSIDQTSEGDFELVVTVKERGGATEDAVEALVKAVKNTRSKMADRIQQFEAELKEQ